MALVELSYAVRLRLVHTQAQFRSRLCRLLLFSLLLRAAACRACVVELTGLNDAGTLSVVAAPDATSRRRELPAGTLTDTTDVGPDSIGGPEELHPSVQYH